ncbi:ATP-binding protein [Dyella choica]|uniref:histidine kinase n=1 Tax=Dyella choica TaxID=1927959 RepID=A0A432MBD9_9GAMM|nr:ATP-binding protein [Dyella choica]RUL80082.1 response regulator [Dyella choica]
MSDKPPVGTWSDLFADGGEMGALMRATDWSRTRLGPVENWPGSLKTMLGVVLGSRFPMMIWWGPELLQLYNDAYRPILRHKHPASLAQPGAQCWAEVWDEAGPLVQSVREGHPATWMEDWQLFISSGDMAEETYFTSSYSAIPGDDGSVAGVLNTVQETTVKVQSERQIRMLHDLARRAADARSEREACQIAVDVLAANALDLPFVLVYGMDQSALSATLIAAHGWKEIDGQPVSARVPIDDQSAARDWPFAAIMRSGQELIVDDLRTRFGPMPSGRWNAPTEQAIVFPLYRTGHAAPSAFFVAGISPHRKLDERYRAFFLATADQVASAMVKARALEEEKQRAEALAEIDRAKTTFFSNVSHEFRTPLTLILGTVEDALARRQPLNGQELDVVQRNGIRLLRLVNSLLDFTRIEAGRLPLSFVPTDLSRLTSELASAFDSLVERADMRLIIGCPPLPEPVYVDQEQWEKIVLNLVSNAFKFTLKGEIEVSLHWHGTYAELRIRDTGVGIPAHELPHIFDRFHRVESSQGRSFEGSGLGLAMVQDLVNLHGGTVRAVSVEGEGTTFFVAVPAGTAHLPAERIVQAPVAATRSAKASAFVLDAAQWSPSTDRNDTSAIPASSHVIDSRPEQQPALAAGRILLADDNGDMREYLLRLLRPYWEVEAVGDGQAALESALNHPPDLILSDIMMPVMDGFALLRALRAQSSTSTIPVILLSARAGEEAILEGLDYGADDYLAKPFTAPELIARVRTHLTMAATRNALNAELVRANQELEAFSHSVAHDLRSPLSSINGFTQILLMQQGQTLDAEARELLEQVLLAAKGMRQTIDDLLTLAHIGRAELRRDPVDLSDLAQKAISVLQRLQPERQIRIKLTPGLTTRGDPGLLRTALDNLIGNAWKYSSKRAQPMIEFGATRANGEVAYYVRDNGAGFDMKYAHKLFAAFQRLHSEKEFPGTGIGLATVHRIVSRHGGRIWADATEGKGATFYFTLP